MDLATITPADFKALFCRDFPYYVGPQPVDCACDPNFVYDSDITRAMGEAKMLFNQGFWGDDADIKTAYLYITAHYLVNDLQTGLSGAGGVPSFLVKSRTVGSVSETYEIPAGYTNNPQMAFYSTSRYGMKYLSMVLPYLVGNIGVVCGATTP